jgi:3-hydroxyacyl-CoA dehydrogenase/enoyl-CoA hydratase/3-hydroxybutyryl-CoA epimerase
VTVTDEMSHVSVSHQGGFTELRIDNPDQSANVLNRPFLEAFGAALDQLEAERDGIEGVVVTSGKPTFCVGGDLNELLGAGREQAGEVFDYITQIKRQLRRLERFDRPVVAAINGLALGGGLEIALACHHRIAVKGARVGFPEVTLGLLPGAGGLTRSVRMLGITEAVYKLLISGKSYDAAAAAEMGLVDEVVDSTDELAVRAQAWIETKPELEKPWDTPGFELPGGSPSDHSFAMSLSGLAADVRRRLKGVDLPAPRAIIAAAVEGAQVDFENAQTIETRYFVELATGQIAQNMMRGNFFDLQTVNSGAARPDGFERFTAKKIGVLGAGMMGSAIAYVCARAGIDVVLKDVSAEVAEQGKGYSERLLGRAIEKGDGSEEEKREILARITATGDPEALRGCDSVIEAVLEEPDVKQAVFDEVDGMIEPDALLASNTSSIPISDLATKVSRPADFIGMHFFSPVDRMALVEIVVGAATNDETLARSFDLARQMGKTPIVVNDSRGFFTSRVIESFINEAIAMVGEGCNPLSVERAGSQAGYPAPPLRLMDQLTLTLLRRVRKQTRAATEAEGRPYHEHPAEPIIDHLIDDLGREGRSRGKGFYDYVDGRRVGIWPGLIEEYTNPEIDVPIEDMKERMLFLESIETVKCFEENVVRSAADANVGSLLGIGYPAWTGGTVQYMNGYPGGLRGFVARSTELAERYGSRFDPPPSLVASAEAGGTYTG